MNTPILHDAHVEAAFDAMLANLPLAQWHTPAPKLPAPPAVVRLPKGSKLLLALITRSAPKLSTFAYTDFDYAALLDSDVVPPPFDLETFTDF